MTKRDTFLSKADYMQLVYAACSPTRPGLTDAADHVLMPPTILKPEPLYTGKQASQAKLCSVTIKSYIFTRRAVICKSQSLQQIPFWLTQATVM